MATLPAGLLEAVRNYLDITWEDTAGDLKLSGIIAPCNVQVVSDGFEQSGG